jgi:protease IV
VLGALFRLVLVNLLGNILRLLANGPRLIRSRRRPAWAQILIKGPLPARAPHRSWLRRRRPSLEGLARAFEELGKDEHLVGVVLGLHHMSGGWARAQSLRGLVARLRARGKRVVVHLSGATLREYYAACGADAVVADESAPLSLTGMAAETTFFAGALRKAGVEAQVEYRGSYKSFAETFTREDMSAAHREAVEAILDRLDSEVVAAVAEGRKLERGVAAARMTGGPYPADEAQRLGLLDGVHYFDDLPAYLGTARPPATVPEWRRRRLVPLRWKPLFPRRRVRVIDLSGAIVPGEGSGLGRPTLGAEPAVRALEAARKNRRVAAVVMHVNSRGGSAVASDLIWRKASLLAKDKPVIAYLDDVAASGGYYISCAATKIVAQPATLTGSIGVVAGKLSLEALWGRLGLRTAILSRGEAAAMHHPSRGYTPEQRRRLAGEVEALYAQFVRKVAAGRKLDAAAAEAAAQGRVWTGADARERGLVDEMGDAEAAVELARTLGRRHPAETLEVENAHLAPRRSTLLYRLLAGGGLASALPEPFLFADERALLWMPELVIH